MTVHLFILNMFSGVKVQETPPALPASGADSIYSYENLPAKHWKKYMYASRFVQLVRTKTPKVTYYSPKAKCQLMENLDDFEVCFYDGVKISKSSTDGTVQMTNAAGLVISDIAEQTHGTDQMLWEHFQHCLHHCMTLEKTLQGLHTDGECFPVIIGRRPVVTAPCVRGTTRDYDVNVLTPRNVNVRKII